MILAAALVLSGFANVTDGDTIKIGNERIRLYGIDTPELRQSCQLGPRTVACGVQSKDRLVAIIGNRPVRCEGKSRDKYRRLVATCYAGGRDIGRQLVNDGWALAYRRYSLAYVSEEGRARIARRGLWSLSFELPSQWRKERR